MREAFRPISDNRGNHTNGGICMSNVIDFLEMIGKDAQWRNAPQSEMEIALTNTHIDSELQAAILAKDRKRLEVLLGQVNVCCMEGPAKNDEDEDTEDAPSRDGEEVNSQSVLQVVAMTG
jgi:hypothetical protein